MARAPISTSVNTVGPISYTVPANKYLVFSAHSSRSNGSLNIDGSIASTFKHNSSEASGVYEATALIATGGQVLSAAAASPDPNISIRISGFLYDN